MSETTKQIFFLDTQQDKIKMHLTYVLDEVLKNLDACPLSVRNAANRAVDVIQATVELERPEALTNAELAAGGGDILPSKHPLPNNGDWY